LKKPEASIVERFDSDTITGIRYTAILLACIIVFHMLTRLAWVLVSKVCMNVGRYTKESPDELKTLELVEDVSTDDDIILEEGNEP